MLKEYQKTVLDLESMFGIATAKDPTPENMIKDMMTKTVSSKDSSFAVVGIRCNKEDSTGKRKMTAGIVYNFLSGYHIFEDCIRVSKEQQNQNVLYDDFFDDDVDSIPHIQISAIVGQNGSGKSSIVEFMMRLINNFAASTIGELPTNTVFDRLHYIDSIDGELWYLLEKKAYHLKIKNANVKLYTYLDKIDETEYSVYNNEKLLFENGKNETCKELKVLHSGLDIEQIKTLYENFFYTLVSNQSIYAYNVYDYKNECNSDEKEAEATGNNSNTKFEIYDKCWLNGLFHKNDAYKTPITISPYRNRGNIEINNEKELAIERLVRLYALHEDLRLINGHLLVDCLRYTYEPDKTYGYDKVVSKLKYKELTSKGYSNLKNDIIEQWSLLIKKNLFLFSTKPYYDDAIDYIVYKTLKISYQYKEYCSFYDATCMMTDVYNQQLLKDYIQSLATDNSHITRKIYQSIAYIIFDVFRLNENRDDDNNKLISSEEINFSDLAKRWFEGAEFRDRSDYSNLIFNIRMQAVVPPSFMKMNISLCDKENYGVKIDFESLSSGEKQQIYSVTSLLYHLDNLNSVHEVVKKDHRVLYNNVCVILEEIELYYHPELQQQFIHYFLNSLKQIRLANLHAIHIIIITHSPYVLSDIPRTNVLALKKDENRPTNELVTFGANIHDMLKNSFFLKGGALGYFSQWEVGHLIACMKIHQWAKQSEDKKKCLFLNDKGIYSFLERYTYFDVDNPQHAKNLFSYEHFYKDFSPSILKERILLFDEPVIFHVLMDEYKQTFPSMTNEIKELKRQELLRQLDELDK